MLKLSFRGLWPCLEHASFFLAGRFNVVRNAQCEEQNRKLLRGTGGAVVLKRVVDVGLFWQLQVPHVGDVLLPRVVQFTALTQCLVVDRQRHSMHVHQLVVGDSGLGEEDRDRKGDSLYRLLHAGAEGRLESECFLL